MKISEIDADSRKVELEATVTEKSEAREVNTKYGKTKVSNATIEDDSGSITLVLWGDDCERINDGDKIRIENGFVREWNGTMQLSVGKYGKLLVV